MLRRIVFALLVGLCLMLSPAASFAQEKKKDQPTPPAKPDDKPKADKPGDKPKGEGKPGDPHGGMSAEEMAEMMKMMLPGPAHQKLAKYVGDWNVKSTMTHGPGAPSEATEGTSKIDMVLDGRFFHEEKAGTMMDMPMKSAHLLGYNNGSKKYEGVWMYTMGTGMMMLSGESKDGGKTVVCTATFDNEMGIKESMAITYTFTDDDHFSWKLDAGKMPDGSPGPVMEAHYTRKK